MYAYQQIPEKTGKAYTGRRMSSIWSCFSSSSSSSSRSSSSKKKKRSRNGLPTMSKGSDKFAHAPASKFDVVAEQASVTVPSTARSLPFAADNPIAKSSSARFSVPVLISSDKSESDLSIVEQAALADDFLIESWRPSSSSSSSRNTTMLLVSVALWKAAAVKSIASLTWAAVSTASSSAASLRKKTEQLGPVSSLVLAADSSASTSQLPDPLTSKSSMSPGTLPPVLEPGDQSYSTPASPSRPSRNRRNLSPEDRPDNKKLLRCHTVIGTVQATNTRLQATALERDGKGCNLTILVAVLLVVQAALLAGQLQAIVITSCFWFLLPRISIRRKSETAAGVVEDPPGPSAPVSEVEAGSSHGQTVPRSRSSSTGELHDYSSTEYRKKVSAAQSFHNLLHVRPGNPKQVYDVPYPDRLCKL
ncbi:hypothetical protein SELMODRAFT_444191 [Selaginella moellendorffii]|uniref:Uncharacterized protein n=1 Tax=Selaginella moellendorffii TaxID=88036 RepID=D8S7R0_SELML|nr:hypothetical protein SELMODRAFT_444191 [Selaginella moellendorffii]